MLLLLLILSTNQSSVLQQVHTLRSENTTGIIELSTAVSISSNHAVALGLFFPGAPVMVDTDIGTIEPDSIVYSLDLGIVVLIFDEEVFSDYQLPSDCVPQIGDRLQIIGQSLTGVIAVEGSAFENYPDGAVLLTSELREGLMGAAVFDCSDRFVGIITGVIQPDQQFPDEGGKDYLVLYPSQIWYMWAQLATLQDNIDESFFGVTAMSRISLSRTRPSGIQLISVMENSTAWELGFRPGDLITHIDDIPVYHPETLRGLLIVSEDTLNVRVLSRGIERYVLIP